MHDLVIRGGTVVDGTGAAPRTADVAVRDGVIVAVGTDDGGRVDGRGHQEIDADGRLVTPGWVDVHTHYDGQATWDSELTPSAWHGVTTAVFGNCSVGFAPVRAGHQRYLIDLMEGVEDIPGSVLAEGVSFDWESFPDYLDALERRPRTVDVGAQLPHGALRFYVMGERGAEHDEHPSDDELERMSTLVQQAVEAGALGCSTSRTVKHRTKDGRSTPSLTAQERELRAIAEGLRRAGKGVVQANSDFATPEEFELLRMMGEHSGRPVSFSLLQVNHAPDRWRDLLDRVAAANHAGVRMTGQVSSRPIGVLLGLQATIHPWVDHLTYRDLAHLPLPKLVAELRRPEVRAAMLAERIEGGRGAMARAALTSTYELGDPVDYEPDPSTSVSAQATAAGVSLLGHVYDLLLADDGRALLYHPFENYSAGNLDVVREMLLSPYTISGLSDGGAHVGTVCDASFPTTLLTHWVRDRTRGPRLPIEHVVRRQTLDTAAALGLVDRGAVVPGLRADLNVIDLDALCSHPPVIVHDLPAGGRRLVQHASGYSHTFLGGEQTYVEGQWTGATPGGLIRG